MNNLWNKACAFMQFLKSRTFAVSLLSLFFAVIVFKITSLTKAVYVVDSQDRTLTFSMQEQPSSALQALDAGTLAVKQANIEDDNGHFTQINLTPYLNVAVKADGKTSTFQVESGTTVGQLLYQNDITYDGNDLLSPAAEKPLEDGDEIILQRVEYENYTVDEEIPYETVHKNSSLLKLGYSKCIQQGENGVKTLSYVRRTVDGVREDVQLLGEQVVKPPVTETILIGSLEPISKMDFDLDVDENGKPLHYKQVLTNQVATGYSAREGAKTASGRYAITGHVAVDPNEIPYGSKLYIVSADNKFVYGCAIAADTGTGLLADIVDVDLFYDTYQESVLNGRRIVDIYILE